MNLRLIVSAFVAGANQDDNARQTARLIDSCSAFDMALVQGCYNGVHETGIQLTGFTDVQNLHETAAFLLREFEQTAVYYSIDGVGSLLHADGRHQTIGAEKVFPADMVHSHLFRDIFKNYTVYADGSALAATNVLKAAA